MPPSHDHPTIPRATYRIQFHKDFTLAQACELVPYLSDLGVSHVYASPVFRATPGSQHGYDICDHNQINPELGSRADFDALAQELSRRGMGLILDFVPNHMGIEEASNGWWMDVLENGRSSPYARFFDIDWQPAMRALENKVLLPILGDQYGRVLESGDLKLSFEHGSFQLHYFDRVLPLAPRTVQPILKKAEARLRNHGQTVPAELESIIFSLDHLPERSEQNEEKLLARIREKEVIKTRLAKLCVEDARVKQAIDEVSDEIQTGGTERNFDAFDELLSAQPYRLAYWRVAAEDINYRRFFDINNLAAIRMELPEVFQATHKLVLELLSIEGVEGLRIDHVDGLWDPRGYLSELQNHYAANLNLTADTKPLYLLVEKILAKDELLRRDWLIHGTTGYEFGAQALNVLLDRDAEKVMTEVYHKFTGIVLPYPDIAYDGKSLTMRSAMASEVNVLALMLKRISETHRWYRDFTLNALAAALREVIACFPVYRTYISPEGEISPEDARIIQRAIGSARRRNPALERSVFEFIRDILVPPAENLHPVNEDLRRQFIMKLQQCTGPITAKGVEDTAFYVYNRLVALNEVGGDPGAFGATVEKFHDQTQARAQQFPHNMLATSTHDTKRSEDMRCRLAALTEMPQEWAKTVRRWHQANRRFKQQVVGECVPDSNEEYLLYQTLLGSWPLSPMSPDERKIYVERIQNYVVKAAHEAKVNTSWMEPNEAWDKGLQDFVQRILEPGAKNRFLPLFEPFAARIAELGALNSLSLLTLKLTTPGVPDIYQGQELWDFSLVDPDNRRPVDYEARRAAIESLGDQPSCSDLLSHWQNGRIKLFITRTLLQLRQQHPLLFQSGSYEALRVEGELANHVIAFRRTYENQSLVIIVPRLTLALGPFPIGGIWKETVLQLSSKVGLKSLFTGQALDAASNFRLADLLAEFPIATLITTEAAAPSASVSEASH